VWTNYGYIITEGCQECIVVLFSNIACLHNIFILPLAANLPPRLRGNNSFQVYTGILSAYTFNVSDDNDDQVQVNIVGGTPANGNLIRVNSTTYTFTWNLMDPGLASNLTFYASDSLGAVGVLSPRIVVCGCQNRGNCTSDGVLSPQNNILIMNCYCPSGN